MSSGRYPEIRADESRLAPHASDARSEWPKKIRFLSAVELDRLTIDANGRFYWDGKPVAYDTVAKPTPAETESAALDMLDRAATEFSERKTHWPAGAKSAAAAREPTAQPANSNAPSLSALVAASDSDDAQPAASHGRAAASAPAGGRPRLRLSVWQSVLGFFVVTAIVAGAAGVAVQGLVTGHEWGCKTGLISAYCSKVSVSTRQAIE